MSETEWVKGVIETTMAKYGYLDITAYNLGLFESALEAEIGVPVDVMYLPAPANHHVVRPSEMLIRVHTSQGMQRYARYKNYAGDWIIERVGDRT